MFHHNLLLITLCFPCSILVNSFVPQTTSSSYYLSKNLRTSPFDNLLGGIFGNSDEDNAFDDDKDDVSISSFQQELTKRQQNKEEILSPPITTDDEDEEFSGYDLRDIIFYKYGECFDVQFQRVDSYGVRAVYLVSLD